MSTRGDAFAMEVEGRTLAERKVAGDTLLTRLRLAARERQSREWAIGRFAGFELTGGVQRGRTGQFEAALILRRTGYEQEITLEDDLTPLGLIARLEHMLDHLEADLAEQQRRARDAARGWRATRTGSARRFRCRANSRPNSPALARSRRTSPRTKARPASEEPMNRPEAA